MIRGAVNNAHQATIPLSVSGPAGRAVDIQAMIDTGFTGFVALPPQVVTDLGLPFKSRSEVTLADGRVESLPVHELTVLWNEQARVVDALAAGSTPLVGMQMLAGHDLHVRVRAGGPVTIEAEA